MVVPLLLVWRLIFAGEVLYWGVPLTQFYPWHVLINRALAAGRWPLWTDLLGNGAPLLANLQTAFFYPPNLLFRLLPVERALGYSVVLHVIGAGLAAAYWGRTLGLSGLGRTVIALSYALGGYVVGRTQFITMVAAYAWLPLLLALTERLIQRRRGTDAVWLGGALALQLWAGHAQIWFYSMLLMAAYGLYRILQHAVRSRSTESLKSGLPGLALAAGLGLGLSAVQLIPTAELALNSLRRAGADWDFAMTYSFWPWRLLTLLAPNLFGSPALGNYAGYAAYWEDTAYVGILPLIFAATAVVIWFKRITALPPDTLPPGASSGKSQQSSSLSLSVIPFFALLVPVAILLAMGKNTPIFPFVFRSLPGFAFFQAPARMMLWFAVAVSTLAGIGAHHFRLTYRKQYALRLTAAGAGAMLVVSLAMLGARVALGGVYLPAVTRLAITLGLACGLLLLRGREPDGRDGRVVSSLLPRPLWGPLIAGLLCIDLLWFGLPLTPTISADLYRLPNQAAHAVRPHTTETRLYVDPALEYDLTFNHYFRFDAFGPPDVAEWTPLQETLLPNLNAVHGIPSANNNEPLAIGRWREMLNKTADADPPTAGRLLQLMNVGVVLAQDPPPDSSPLAAIPHLYSLDDPLPRAWLVPAARVIADADALLSELMAPDFDPRAEVLLEPPTNTAELGEVSRETASPDVSSAAGGLAISLREEWNRRTIDLIASQPSYLVLAYTYYPGWQATADGHPAQILRANYAFMALAVESGPHHVVLTYRPGSLLWGLIISSLSALAMIGIVAVSKPTDLLSSG